MTGSIITISIIFVIILVNKTRILVLIILMFFLIRVVVVVVLLFIVIIMMMMMFLSLALSLPPSLRRHLLKELMQQNVTISSPSLRRGVVKIGSRISFLFCRSNSGRSSGRTSTRSSRL